MENDSKENAERRFNEAMKEIRRKELAEKIILMFYLVLATILEIGSIIALFKYIF